MFRIIFGMQCPYCQTPLTETSEECSYCSLSLQSANSLLGPVPRLTTGLNDILSVLEKKAQSKTTKSLTKLSQRFPQVRMHIIINNFDPNYPLSTHLFWLFNQGALCTSDRKGGKNHSILLGLDTTQGRGGLIVGYGLEPFLPQKALDHVLEKAQPLLSEGNHSEAILAIIDDIAELMRKTCDELEEILDLAKTETSHQIEY